MFEKYKLIVILKPRCPWCNMLKNQTLPLVHAAGIKAYEVIGQAVEEYYGVEAFPALIYTDLEGNMLYKEEGYVPMKRVVEVFTKLENNEEIEENNNNDDDFDLQQDYDQLAGNSDEQDLSPDSELNPPIVEQETETSNKPEPESNLSPRKKRAIKNREANP